MIRALEGSGELLDLWTADAIAGIPALGLKVDRIEPERIFVDDAVNPAVAAATDGLTRILPGAAVTHFHKQIHDEPFKPLRGALTHRRQ